MQFIFIGRFFFEKIGAEYLSQKVPHGFSRNETDGRTAGSGPTLKNKNSGVELGGGGTAATTDSRIPTGTSRHAPLLTMVSNIFVG
jgi:hypothetical protein